MESKQRDNKRSNNNRRLYFILTPIAIIISIVVFFQSQIDSKISNHPDVVLSKDRIEKIDKRLENIENKLGRLQQMDWKLDELLRQEYP